MVCQKSGADFMYLVFLIDGKINGITSNTILIDVTYQFVERFDSPTV